MREEEEEAWDEQTSSLKLCMSVPRVQMKHLPEADEIKLTKNIFPNDERLLDYMTCKRWKKERNDIEEIWKV